MYILRIKITLTSEQRVLHDLLRTRLSRRPMIWLPPTPFPPRTGRLIKIDNLLAGERGRGVGGGKAKSDDSEKAWSSINHSILSASERYEEIKKPGHKI
jgi:hypothetical protein